MTTLAGRDDLERPPPTPPHPAPGLRDRFSPRTLDAIALTILVAAIALPVRGALLRSGPHMEEGTMLVFPERVLAGDVPNLDFLHLYGPGSLWTLAGVYKLFGTDLVVERLFGLLQQSALVFGIYFLARLWGRRLAVTCALLMLVIMLPSGGLTALAWPGALALAVLGIVAALASRAARDDRRGRALGILAGAIFGIALLYRPDLVVAVALVMAVMLWKAPRRRAVPMVAALVATTALYLVQFALAGFDAAFNGMFIDPVFNLRSGRSLPIPPPWGTYDGFLQYAGDTRLLPWPVPTLAGPHQLFLFFFALLATLSFLVAIAVRCAIRHPGSARARTLLAVALFNVGILPQALQRPDSTHVAWVGCISIAFLPVAIFELLRDPPRAPGRRARLRVSTAQLVACAVPVLTILFVLPNFTVQRYADFVAQTFDRHRDAFAIQRDGRTFYSNQAIAESAQQAVDLVDKTSTPGERLFVGPGDLRKTIYSDAWLYYLFPDLTPATRYIEMDPGVANAKGSGLARDLRSADVVILSTVWDGWNEPNDSGVLGSDRPNQVLARDFCQTGDFGAYRVYRRCTK